MGYVHRKGFRFDSSKGDYSYAELSRQRAAYDNYTDQPRGTNMARYKPAAEHHGLNVYIGGKTDIGTLRTLALNRVGAGADAQTFNDLKALIYQMDEPTLRGRMAGLERTGEFDISPVPPAPDVVW